MAVLSQSYRFRWIVCQLGALRLCFPSAIRRTLDQLPRGLDETYDRILLGIPRERQDYAQRLFQCLAVSIRPLRVDELAEILAIQFDVGAMPNYDPNWRADDPEEAVLSACSTLITIFDIDGERVLQFSHFSVKEYLTSERLANAEKHLSQYHILPRSAHTIIAQASLSVLLALDCQVDKTNMVDFPFAIYAARYWVNHAQFDDVSSNIEEAMECLFDSAEPQFAIWVWIYDIDYPFRGVMFTHHPTPPEAVPLYYATLCGFRDLARHLLNTCPQDINARGGYCSTPLHTAVIKGSIDIVVLFLEHGADMTALNIDGATPLHEASKRGRLDVMQLLLDNHADVDAQGRKWVTPLYQASLEGDLEVIQVLLRHGASLETRNEDGWTPLMAAAHNGHLGVACLLLQNGATRDTHNKDGWTPLEIASCRHPDIVRLLLESGAAVDTRDNLGLTPLGIASCHGHIDIVRLLIERGAAVDSRNNIDGTPLEIASCFWHPDIVRLLLESGATVDSRDNTGWTPLAMASCYGHPDIVHLLLESGAAVNSRDNIGWTPLGIASCYGRPDIVRLLLESGAAVDSRDDIGWTPLETASCYGHPDIVRLLIENGAAVDPPSNDDWTRLGIASCHGHLDIRVVRLLVKRGAAVGPCNTSGWAPFPMASLYGHIDVVRILIESGIDVEYDGSTPVISQARHLGVMRFLLRNGVSRRPPLCLSSSFIVIPQVQVRKSRASALLSMSRPPMAISSFLHYSYSTGHMLTLGIITGTPHCTLRQITGNSRLCTCYSRLAQM